MKVDSEDFFLRQIFNKHVCKNGELIYWRDCVLRPGMQHGEQGYLWFYEDGSTFHSYRTPEDCDL